MIKLFSVCQTNQILNERIQNIKDENQKMFEKMKIRIAKAILAEAEKRGSTRQFIKKYLEANYRVAPNDPWINRTIQLLTSLTSGPRLIVNKQHTGHYRVSPELRKQVKMLYL